MRVYTFNILLLNLKVYYECVRKCVFKYFDEEKTAMNSEKYVLFYIFLMFNNTINAMKEKNYNKIKLKKKHKHNKNNIKKET